MPIHESRFEIPAVWFGIVQKVERMGVRNQNTRRRLDRNPSKRSRYSHVCHRNAWKKSKAWPKYENQLIHLCYSFLSRDFNSFLCYFRRIFRVGMSPTRCRPRNSRSLSALQSRPWIRVGGWRTFIRCHLTLLFSLCFFHILYIQLLGPQKGVGHKQCLR